MIEVYKQHESIILSTGRVPLELLPKTKEESIILLAQYPKQYYNTIKPLSIKECVLSPVCTLGAFNRATTNENTGNMTVSALVVTMLTDLVSFFNVGKTMSEVQLAQTAEIIIDTYGYLKIDDFKFCFSSAKKCLYGVVYDRLDGNVIISWIEQYLSDRISVSDNLNYSDHVSMKANEKSSQSFLEIQSKHKI